jgi:ABC-type glycerol-3-phosphate transport system substrate-binding protein
MKTFSKALLASGAMLALAACGGTADDAAGDNVAYAAENQADAMEEMADNATGATEDALENQAEAVRDAGEAKEEAIDDTDGNMAAAGNSL